MKRFLLPLLLMLAFAANARGLGMERFGNKPLRGNNYKAWPGVMKVINDTHRVYYVWVNGNEQFFYEGDTVALNETLQNFAKIESETLEVLIRPGPGVTSTFSGAKQISFQWDLHLIGGITARMARRDRGQHLWPTHPMLTIYVGDGISLDALNIPNSVTVIQLVDLQERYAEGLSSTDQTVRGWACGALAKLDRYNTETMNRIAAMLADESDWVRSNAAGAIAVYGDRATAVLDKLQAAGKSEDKLLTNRVKETIASITAAIPAPQAQRQHEQTLKAIRDYCESR